MKVHFGFFLLIFVFISQAQISDFKDVDFTKANNTAKRNHGRSLKNLPLLVHHLTSNLDTDVEKFRSIYLWVCQNIDGDASQHKKVYKQRKKLSGDNDRYLEWNNDFKIEAFEILKKRKKTMCTGYAYLIKELCFIADIKCEIIDGYGRSFDRNVEALEMVNHSWNAVKLDNRWYLCDPTWSSGFMVNGDLFVRNYNNGYFLTEPELFAKSHFPIKGEWYLDSSLENHEFRPTPIVYGETFQQQIIPLQPKDLLTKVKRNDEIIFKFKDLKVVSLEDITLVQIAGNEHKQLNINDIGRNNDLVSFSYSFAGHGLRDVHLKIKEDIVATYSFFISKD